MVKPEVGQVWINKSVRCKLRILRIIDDAKFEYENISSGRFGKPKDKRPLVIEKSTLDRADIFEIMVERS